MGKNKKTKPSPEPWFDDDRRSGNERRRGDERREGGHFVTLGDVATQVRHTEGRVVALEINVEHLRQAAQDNKAATAKLDQKIDRLHTTLVNHAAAEERDRRKFFSGLFFASAAAVATLIAVLGQITYWAATEHHAAVDQKPGAQWDVRDKVKDPRPTTQNKANTQ